jgi:predicted  nucleic acid-binding Zn-ribbon protein
MPHQCLKCGAVFPDGSPQILRGCPDCGGAKFFFTDSSMTDDERNELQEKANKDIKNLIHEMMVNDSIPIKAKKESVKKDEWVYLGSVDEKEKGKDDVKTQSEVEKKIMKSIEELQFPKEGRLKRLKFASKSEKKAAKEDVKALKASAKSKVKAKKAAPKDEVKAKKVATKAGTAKKTSKKEKKDNVAVITITDEGVYELDVEKLMEHSPIIVQKDGSYMVHLPSVFKGKDKGSAI